MAARAQAGRFGELQPLLGLLPARGQRPHAGASRLDAQGVRRASRDHGAGDRLPGGAGGRGRLSPPGEAELLDAEGGLLATLTLPTSAIPPSVALKPEPPIGPLAFIDHQEHLILRDEDGALCALTTEGAAASPAWSPEGARLAHSYQAGEGAAAELRIYHLADRTHETVWVDPGFLDPLVLPFREIAWAPSGRYVFLGQGCCVQGSIYVLDLETRSLAGQYTSYGRVLWSPGEDLLALTVPQPVNTLIPIESGDSSSVTLARPGQITPTLVLTGIVERMYRAHAWLSTNELLYEQADLYEGGNRIESSWWSAEIRVRADGTPTVAASHPVESLPLWLWHLRGRRGVVRWSFHSDRPALSCAASRAALGARLK